MLCIALALCSSGVSSCIFSSLLQFEILTVSGRECLRFGS